MQAPKTLRRPGNWQDFESLCKKLWGEIWNCPEIKKNGRNGQQQHGVDVYGIPFGESAYFGIQCKGKDEYTHQQFSKAEIAKEIKKARKFQPALRKLYFATTSVKDAKIEAFVRTTNVENINQGIFEVHLFSWEDIVDLIDENKQTHDWYIASHNFKTEKDITFTFEGGSTEITCNPKFRQTITCYVQDHREGTYADVFMRDNSIFNLASRMAAIHFDATHINLSFFKVSLCLTNKGTSPIEEYKVILEFEGDVDDLKDTNESGGISFIRPNYIPTTYLYKENKSGKLIPRSKILVGSDVFLPEDIFIKTKPIDSKIIIKWKLISTDFKKEGELVINVQPEIEKKKSYIQISNQLDVRREVGDIEDYVIPKD